LGNAKTGKGNTKTSGANAHRKRQSKGLLVRRDDWDSGPVEHQTKKGIPVWIWYDNATLDQDSRCGETVAGLASGTEIDSRN